MFSVFLNFLFPPTKHDLNQYVQHGAGAKLKNFLAHQVIVYEEKWRKAEGEGKSKEYFSISLI